MTPAPGFKGAGSIGLQQELPRIKKAAGKGWTPSPVGAGRIKASEPAVQLGSVLFGGRPNREITNEHPSGGADE